MPESLEDALSSRVPSTELNISNENENGKQTHLPARRTQAHTQALVSPFYTFSEHQPKDIEDNVCMYHSILKSMYRAAKVQEYVLFLEYFKVIVNCSCVQKKNKK